MNYAITVQARIAPMSRPYVCRLAFPNEACARHVAAALDERWASFKHGVRETATPATHPDAHTWLRANGFEEAAQVSAGS